MASHTAPAAVNDQVMAESSFMRLFHVLFVTLEQYYSEVRVLAWVLWFSHGYPPVLLTA